MPLNDRTMEPQDSRYRPEPEDRLPNERTRLLSPNDSEQAWLSPNDPAVSPYNLWSVRILRIFTVVLLGLTSIWFCALLISLFATPPGLHVRGSAFWSLVYTMVTLVMLAMTLMFFNAPASSSQILTWAIVALVANGILVLAVEQLRLEEGRMGWHL